jgi:aminoglycoside/choline kinase family phosphotransferase
MKRLIYHIATVDYTLMRRDAKKVAEWQLERIIPCHGDVLESGSNEAWASVYEWFLKGKIEPNLMKRLMSPIMKVARRVFLM